MAERSLPTSGMNETAGAVRLRPNEAKLMLICGELSLLADTIASDQLRR